MEPGNLSAERLLELGALKQRCSAPIACVSHGLSWPCELCELEEKRGVLCSACGQVYDDAKTVSGERDCSSVAQFQATGRIAFADAVALPASETATPVSTEPVTAVETDQGIPRAPTRPKGPRYKNSDSGEESRHRRERLRRTDSSAKSRTVHDEEKAREAAQARASRKWEARERERKELEQANRDRLKQEARERADKRSAEERTRDLSPPPAKPPRKRKDPAAEAPAPAPAQGLHAARARQASFIATALGAWGAWFLGEAADRATRPMIEAAAFGATAFMIWFIGCRVLGERNSATAGLRWWAPIPWMLVAFGWPALAGRGIAHLVIRPSQSVEYAAQLAVSLMLLWISVALIKRSGIALSMRPPWPSGVGADFKALGSLWVWCGLLVTLCVDLVVGVGLLLALR